MAHSLLLKTPPLQADSSDCRRDRGRDISRPVKVIHIFTQPQLVAPLKDGQFRGNLGKRARKSLMLPTNRGGTFQMCTLTTYNIHSSLGI